MPSTCALRVLLLLVAMISSALTEVSMNSEPVTHLNLVFLFIHAPIVANI